MFFVFLIADFGFLQARGGQGNISTLLGGAVEETFVYILPPCTHYSEWDLLGLFGLVFVTLACGSLVFYRKG